MKNLLELNEYRDRKAELLVYNVKQDSSTTGCFLFPSPVDGGGELRIIASSGMGWDHVSISCYDRTPTWEEMEFIRRQLFHDYETVIQIHPPLSEYVTGEWPGHCSRFTLHLWRTTKIPQPRPPRWMVGANSPEEARLHHKQASEAMNKRPRR